MAREDSQAALRNKKKKRIVRKKRVLRKDQDEVAGADPKLRKLILEIDKAILRESLAAVEKGSCFNCLAEHALESPATLLLEEYVEEAREKFPVSTRCVEGISRNYGWDHLDTFVAHIMLLKKGAKRNAGGLAVIFSLASVLDGVRRKGFDTLSKVCGLTYSHQHTYAILDIILKNWPHYMLFDLFGRMLIDGNGVEKPLILGENL